MREGFLRKSQRESQVGIDVSGVTGDVGHREMYVRLFDSLKDGRGSLDQLHRRISPAPIAQRSPQRV